MKRPATPQVSAGILKRAQSFPGILAGIASLDALRVSPSHTVNTAVEWKSGAEYETVETADWPPEAKSVLVLALHHPLSKPDLDWWDGKGTPGNRVLMSVGRKMADWFKDALEAGAKALPYHVESGGVFLKDAAVLAGLGVIGLNNLLLTPEFGPHVRLRAIFLEAELVPTGPIDWFDPCGSCDEPCRRVCPQNALEDIYARGRCMLQMEDDRAAGYQMAEENPDAVVQVKYCRRCEQVCPAGSWDK